jgi:hypothetical protein
MGTLEILRLPPYRLNRSLNRMDWTVLTLNNEDHNRQVKKLVLAACTGNWENDPQQLANVSLSRLLIDLMQRYPSPEQLQDRLDTIVENLNKKTEYRRVARLVIEQLEPLYPPTEPTGFLDSKLLNVQPVGTLPTEGFNPLLLEVDSDPTEVTESFGDEVEAGADVQVEAVSYIAPELLQANPGETEEVGMAGQLHPPDHWFDIRWEIMKYANPLAVKILLYSAIYPSFDFSHSAWQRLQGVPLDDLLAACVSHYRYLSDLDQTLQETATKLERTVAFAPGTLTTVVPSILQALQPLTKPVLQPQP